MFYTRKYKTTRTRSL